LALKLPAERSNAEVSLSVGALFSLTGNSADLGTQSKLMMETATGDLDALLGDFSDRPHASDTGVSFDLMFEDTQFDPTIAANEAKRLIDRGAQFLIGPQTSAEVAAVKPITDAAGVVLISQGSTASSLSIPNDTVFRFVPDDTLESKAIAAAAAGMGIKAMVPVWRGDAGNQGLAASLRNLGPGLGIAVAAGLEYPTAGANFTTVAAELATAVGNLNLPLSQIAVFVAGFDEAADLLNAASASSDLSSVRWFATDGIALSSAFLAPGPAQFAEMTHLAAANLGLPAEAQPLRDPILQVTGLASPIPFAFAAYDAFVCATLAWLLAGEERTKVRDTLALVAKQHFGTTGWTLLNANGDRAIGSFEFFGIVNGSGGSQWTGLFSQQVS
jgi:branched-chain amino acid transport system substrate-binding protein